MNLKVSVISRNFSVVLLDETIEHVETELNMSLYVQITVELQLGSTTNKQNVQLSFHCPFKRRTNHLILG